MTRNTKNGFEAPLPIPKDTHSKKPCDGAIPKAQPSPPKNTNTHGARRNVTSTRSGLPSCLALAGHALRDLQLGRPCGLHPCLPRQRVTEAPWLLRVVGGAGWRVGQVGWRDSEKPSPSTQIPDRIHISCRLDRRRKNPLCQFFWGRGA